MSPIVLQTEGAPAMPRIIHLISGTAKTGKDTLHRLLTSGKLIYNEYTMFELPTSPLWIAWPIAMLWAIGQMMIYYVLKMCHIHSSESHRRFHCPRVYWYVFGTYNATRRALSENLFVTRNRRRFAFADALKQYCNGQMQKHTIDGQFHTDEWFEQHKDDLVIKRDDTLVTPRDVYIQLGTSKRQDDPNIWARKCFDAIDDLSSDQKDSDSSGDTPPIIDITDYRFRNECAYAKRIDPLCRRSFQLHLRRSVFTTRLYRGIKPSDDPSEHDLDHEMPDFLMVESMWHYAQCLWAHPEYAEYGIIGEMLRVVEPEPGSEE